MRLLNSFRTLIVIGGFFCAAFAQAYTITVNTPVDEDMVGGAGCSLREAITLRNLNVGATYNDCTATPGFVAGEAVTINFNADYIGTPIDVGSSLSILGGTLGTLTITGTGHTVHITCITDPTQIFIEAADATFTLSNVLMDGCTAPGAGIAIDNTAGGNLTITNTTFDSFHSNNGAGGGAVNHYGGGGGVLTISNSTFTNNTADDSISNSGDGGALYFSSIMAGSAPSSLTDVTFTGNTAGNNGGAINYANPLAPPYSMLLTRVTFTNNTANGDGSFADAGGGAIYEDVDGGVPTGVFLISNSTFTGNTAPNGEGGAIAMGGGSRLTYSSATSPDGGGIYGCHFSGNSASGTPSVGNPTNGSGGALFSRGLFTVTQSSFLSNVSTHHSGGAIAHADNVFGSASVIANTTFNGNTANQNGGAIANLDAASTLQLINDTISGNSATGTGATPGGGALYNANTTARSVTAVNTIFGASTGAGGNCAGTAPTNDGNNLQYSPDTAACGAITIGDPLLAAPALNAPAVGTAVTALVRTMAIGESSPASRGGDPATCSAGPINSTDATGSLGTAMVAPSNLRPTPVATSCDIGAYESGSTTPVELQSFSVD